MKVDIIAFHRKGQSHKDVKYPQVIHVFSV